jgi:mRNA-degrading endonuclease RelE of RelBE toxin-antitoxin system
MVWLCEMIEKFYSFRETKAVTKKVIANFSQESYFALQDYLLENATKGDLIPQGKGLRKIRWNADNRGKRGGFRVIYYLTDTKGYIYLMAVYAKNEQNDLTKQQLKDLVESAEEWLK